MWGPKSAEDATDLRRAKAPRKHLDPVAQHHRHPIAEAIGETGVVHVDRLEGVPASSRHRGHHRVRFSTEQAGAAGDEEQVAHCGTVFPVRHGTTIAILLLLALLLVAGVIFVVRLNGVT